MEIRKGIGVSPGVVICPAVVLDAEALVIQRRTVAPADIPAENNRLGQAIANTIVELTRLRDEISARHGKEIGNIFDFHIGILKDKSILKQFTTEINTQSTTAEYAVSTVMRRYANMFQNMSNAYLSERVKDIHDIEKSLLRSLVEKKQEDLSTLQHDVIVIARDLMPSQTAKFDKTHVKGFATDVGGRTSHTAIVARAMGIPAVVGLGNLTGAVSGGDTVIIDGTRGVVIINPDAEQIAEHREQEKKQLKVEAELKTLAALPAVTKDGQQVSVMANIE